MAGFQVLLCDGVYDGFPTVGLNPTECSPYKPSRKNVHLPAYQDTGCGIAAGIADSGIPPESFLSCGLSAVMLSPSLCTR
ncbi:hypothetical protein KGH27_02455 [Bacteroides faecis]|uniref:hypothetical protein n=1 Tax=Bacteroides TaxID=816 RepID=UPI001872C0C9|nr:MULTISPECIES: hypothetical protein [Bacteroides]MDU7617162.1 hypothetical protein [Bacteroides sp.]MBU9878988.1 hypothetical protein [Bacteroides sp. MSK.20.82]MCC2066345.1 hypothetical protein [Bacteroides faecis]MCE8721380.1 hypothetical protein [Bacteroides thetaiotaomicron]MCE8735593.1 hypothetical protein [Bacteroides thetaiotaomicron]